MESHGFFHQLLSLQSDEIILIPHDPQSELSLLQREQNNTFFFLGGGRFSITGKVNNHSHLPGTGAISQNMGLSVVKPDKFQANWDE